MRKWWRLVSEVNSEPETCGLFAPLPPQLARLYPASEGKDPSPKHLTILYIGKLEPAQIRQVHRILKEGLAGTVDGSIKATLGRLLHFNNPDEIVAVNRVDLDQHLVSIRTYTRILLEKNGITVEDRYPHDYKPHVTISYFGENQKYWRTDTDTPQWGGPVPEGYWNFDTVEFWVGNVSEKDSVGPMSGKRYPISLV